MSAFPEHLMPDDGFNHILKLASIFDVENVEKIELVIEKTNPIFKDQKRETLFTSCVTLANDSSRLYHRIKGDSVMDLVIKTEAFIKSIE